MRDLSGQTAIVTGAGSGIGRGIAGVLAGEGAHVVLVDLDAHRAAAVASRIEDAGGQALVVVADVASATDVQRIVDETTSWTGQIDILASNVGIYPMVGLESMDEDVWDRVMTVNVKSAFLLLRAILPIMRRQHYGRVVVTSSITGSLTVVPGLAHYAASKAALMGLVRSAAVEVAGTGVTVNAILPGNVDTEGARAEGGDEYFELMLPSIPVRRFAEPEDIGWAVRMLAAAEASFITEAGLVADGGQSLPEGRFPAAMIDELLGVEI